jgi:predicted pyridoxine 5'-phosphate oxidase superfamily flavin-nucleotide-binding protein
MNKTLANLKANPKIAIYVWGQEVKGCYQIKGTTSVKTSGKEFEEMKAKLNVKNPALPARSLVVVKITDIFECKPSPNAGTKLL